MGEVYKEIHDLLVPGVIPKGAGHGFKCKPVKRRYAFEVEEVPRVRKREEGGLMLLGCVGVLW